TMKLSIKLVPAMALAIALSPFAAQAQAAPQPAPLQYTQTDSCSADAMMVGSSTIDSPTYVYSNNVFPDSFGG
ncbi:MAG TPA: hypothetical protein VHV26_03775, partial [Rhizomicrobium sp.]|nr:hypothetical protein [Rhizomicrobium sp.]